MKKIIVIISVIVSFHCSAQNANYSKYNLEFDGLKVNIETKFNAILNSYELIISLSKSTKQDLFICMDNNGLDGKFPAWYDDTSSLIVFGQLSNPMTITNMFELEKISSWKKITRKISIPKERWERQTCSLTIAYIRKNEDVIKVKKQYRIGQGIYFNYVQKRTIIINRLISNK
jgi:hypothetical protein